MKVRQVVNKCFVWLLPALLLLPPCQLVVQAIVLSNLPYCQVLATPNLLLPVLVSFCPLLPPPLVRVVCMLDRSENSFLSLTLPP